MTDVTCLTNERQEGLSSIPSGLIPSGAIHTELKTMEPIKAQSQSKIKTCNLQYMAYGALCPLTTIV